MRRRLTVTFAFVALAAVALTAWLTLGAVLNAQRDLFAQTPASEPALQDWSATDHTVGGGSPGTARNAFRTVTRTAMLAGFLAFLLATTVAGLVTRRLTRPLVALERGARRLAAGERGLRLDLPPDRDELRSLTGAFNALVGGLERQEEWRRGMVADIAHDLRTPLAVLRSELEAMQDRVRPLDDAGLARLHREVMLLSRLVDDLRTLSTAESGHLELTPRTVKVADYLRTLLDSLAGRAAEAGATLDLDPIPEGLSATFDPDRIARVLGNLLENALRYATPGTVTVSAEREGDRLRIAVRDHGPGLPPGDEERVLERFYRGDPSRTRHEAGSGLGLAIAKAIAESHGGRLEAANHPQGGAVFTVVLPLGAGAGAA
ncbi:MAG: HAMP domain-containing protein [Trueperaceae bacterium]|nr:HAMP domain-containing protein [Trueperaceae bacterium]MCO5173380.1 ATP-binding protein [Trueperaceae bacterium]